MNRFLGLGFLEPAPVLDEEIDEGGGEAGLDDERTTALRRVKIGDEIGYSGHPVLLPWKRHGSLLPLCCNFTCNKDQKKNKRSKVGGKEKKPNWINQSIVQELNEVYGIREKERKRRRVSRGGRK